MYLPFAILFLVMGLQIDYGNILPFSIAKYIPREVSAHAVAIVCYLAAFWMLIQSVQADRIWPWRWTWRYVINLLFRFVFIIICIYVGLYVDEHINNLILRWLSRIFFIGAALGAIFTPDQYEVIKERPGNRRPTF